VRPLSGVLKHLDLTSGQTLLVLGAGGSVGTIAVQLAVGKIILLP
jgi:NADPH:quinone reductase-like Zn-dependent oxidoreductase